MQGVGGTKKRGPKGPSKYTPAFIEAQAEAILIYVEKAEYPTIQEYASTQGIDSNRFGEWANKDSNHYNKKFEGALKQFKDIQYFKWVTKAASGECNPTVFIFFAKNVLGMRDEQYLQGQGFETKQLIQVYLPATDNQVDAPSRTPDLISPE